MINHEQILKDIVENRNKNPMVNKKLFFKELQTESDITVYLGKDEFNSFIFKQTINENSPLELAKRRIYEEVLVKVLNKTYDLFDVIEPKIEKNVYEFLKPRQKEIAIKIEELLIGLSVNEAKELLHCIRKSCEEVKFNINK